ncbi:hypothetical protein CRG98_003582 [Punica granatum]|uniref:Uncharacterized protein n=1 Tax=Punica granatum TaxID=22663 RepID=A0A2I0L5R8_PUNGR|nr:hypothetical protein CRG98_003582 [Punica granatum]
MCPNTLGSVKPIEVLGTLGNKTPNRPVDLVNWRSRNASGPLDCPSRDPQNLGILFGFQKDFGIWPYGSLELPRAGKVFECMLDRDL